jgi:hypothetical protein
MTILDHIDTRVWIADAFEPPDETHGGTGERPPEIDHATGASGRPDPSGGHP